MRRDRACNRLAVLFVSIPVGTLAKLSMPTRVLLAFVVLESAVAPCCSAVDVLLSYGAWSMSPFTSTVEAQCEQIVEAVVKERVGRELPGFITTTFEQNVDLTSAGQFVGVEVARTISGDRFRVGGSITYVELDLPYTLDARQSLSLGRFELADAVTTGTGTVHIKAIDLALLAGWNICRTDRLLITIGSGINILPVEGTIGIDNQTTISTRLGSRSFESAGVESIDELRSESDAISSILVTPLASVTAQVRAFRHGGLVFRALLSQGTFLSGGAYVRF